MAYIFSNPHVEQVSTRQVSAPGIDQEVVHRIRRQGRIERAKIVRRCFAVLRRTATAVHSGGGIS